MEGRQGSLLPLSAITPELLNQVSEELTANDEVITKTGIEPVYWKSMVAKFQEAAQTGSVGNALFPSAIDTIEKNGPKIGPAVVMKAMLLGWRMAEMYLEQQIEKSAEV